MTSSSEKDRKAPTRSSRSKSRTIDLKAEKVEATSEADDQQKQSPKTDSVSAAAGADRQDKAQPDKNPSAPGERASVDAGRRAAHALRRFSNRNWAMMLLAGVAGGVIALAVYALFLPERSTADIEGLQTRLRQTAERLESTRQENAQFREQIQLRLTDLGGAIETLGGRVNELEKTGTAAGVDPDAIAATRQRVEDLENAFSTMRTDSEGEAVGGIDVGAIAEQIADLGSRLQSAEQKIIAAAANDPQNPEAIARIAAADRTATENRQTLDDLRQQIGQLQRLLDDQSSRLDRVAESESERAATGDRLARRMAAEALRTTYMRGAAFAGLLDTAQALSGSQAAPEELRQFADGGVPTVASLTRKFHSIRDEIIAADRPPADGMVDRLVQGARSLVSVRPSGPIEGTSTVAIVSRIGQALEKEDPAAALAEWEKLPPAAREISTEWADELRSRVEADAALAQVIAALEGS